MKYVCSVCGFVYDDEKESTRWEDLPDGWACPVCGVGKELFEAQNPAPAENFAGTAPAEKVADDSVPARTTSDVLAETLRNFGVRRVFGMVGHSNLGVADALRRCVLRGEMDFVGIRHEGAAAFAASAYGKLTGTPAACLTIAGPGATNLVTGLTDAALDRAPVIALTGQVPSRSLGSFAFQEVDLTLALKVAAQTQMTLMPDSDPAALAGTACRNAILTRSVSQIVLPDDVQTLPARDVPAGTPDGAVFGENFGAAAEKSLDAAAETIARAKRPIVIVGEGCRHCVPAALAFAETIGAAVMTTYRAKGFVSDAFPLACGVVGRSGTTVSAKMMAASDCIIGLGVGFSNHSEIAKGKTTVQIDRDPRALGRLRKIDCGVVGELGATLPLLAEKLRGNVVAENPRGEIVALWAEWRAEKSRRAAQSSRGKIAPAAVCEALTQVVPANAIVSVDVGNVAYSFGRYFEARDQRVLLSFYLGSIGVGLPAAIGAWCAAQDDETLRGRPVVAVVGDGGLGQYLAEWTTVVRRGMDIKCVVFNNAELAKISLEQRNARVDVWETSLCNPDFAEFAKLCGSAGITIDDPAQLADGLSRAFATRGPVLINVLTNPDAA